MNQAGAGALRLFFVKNRYEYLVSAKKSEKPKEWTFERIYDIIKCKEKTGKQEKGVHEDV